MLAVEGDHMATLRERLMARREAERRKLRSFTIGVSEDDLRLIAKHGYCGAFSTDHGQQAQAVSLIIADMLAARRQGNGVTPARGDADQKTGETEEN
jgi:hypothetical protein